MPSRTKFLRGIATIPRWTHRRSTIARWLSDMTEELDSQAAAPLRALAANRARRARSSLKGSHRSHIRPVVTATVTKCQFRIRFVRSG